MFLNKQKLSTKMSERTPCKPTLSTNRTITRKSMPQNWMRETWCTCYSAKQVIKEANILSHIFDGRARTLFKRLYYRTIIWLAKLERTEPKCFMLHRMRQRHFTPWHAKADVKTTPWEWKPVAEVIIMHDDLYSRVCVFDYEKPIFDSDQDAPKIPISPGMAVHFDPTNNEISTIRETIQKSSRIVFPQEDRSSDGTDTDHYMEFDANTSVEHLNLIPTNPLSTKFDQPHNPRAELQWWLKYWIFHPSHYDLRSAYVHSLEFPTTCYWIDMQQYLFIPQRP